MANEERHRTLRGGWRWISILFGIIVIFLAINTSFDLRFFVGYHLFNYKLYYIVFGLLLSLSFLLYPPKQGITGRKVFRTDVGLFLLVLGPCMYMTWHAQEMIQKGWSHTAPFAAFVMAAILWFLLVESVRRIYGWILAGLVLLASIYPLFAEHMPGLLQGVQQSFRLTAQLHMLSNQSALGFVLSTYIEVIIGFIVFGSAVATLGGGKFFLNLALSVVGPMRGGVAKVATVASALFGSINGQPMVNVLTTGSVTIPAMKKTGYAPYFAGAVEAVASTGGTFTPPIMGVTAFVMASYLGISYVNVACAAAVPALLYYFVLFVQIDGYAVRHSLKGLSRKEAPRLLTVLKEGWFYIPVIGVLVYFLFVERMIGQAAFYSTGLLLILSQIRKDSRFTWQTFLKFLEETTRTMLGLVIVIAGVGMLIGSLALTGVGLHLARELLILAGGNIGLLLLFALMGGFIMGMGMPMIAVYIFLAIVIAPALIAAGIAPLAAHLFILYVGMLSYITPPIAMAAFVAAPLAKTSPMKVGTTAAQLGGAIYLLPFFFTLSPELLLIGNTSRIVLVIASTILGMFILASAFGGYMIGLGELWPATREHRFSLTSMRSYGLRGILVASGTLLSLPWLQIKGIGLAIAAIVLVPVLVRRRLSKGETKL